MSDELKPCPFCGADPVMVPWHGGRPTKKCVYCDNDDCHVVPGVTGGTRGEAVDKWNARPVEDALRERAGKAERELKEAREDVLGTLYDRLGAVGRIEAGEAELILDCIGAAPTKREFIYAVVAALDEKERP